MSEEPQGPANVERIVGNFEVTLNLSDKRGIKMIGYVYLTDDAKALNQRIDWYMDTLDRQAIRADMVTKEAQIAMHRINVEAMIDDYDSIMTKQKAGKALTSQEKLKLRVHSDQLAQAKKYVESLDAAIRAGKEKLATT